MEIAPLLLVLIALVALLLVVVAFIAGMQVKNAALGAWTLVASSAFGRKPRDPEPDPIHVPPT